MSSTSSTDTVNHRTAAPVETEGIDYALLSALDAGERPPRPSAVSASITHGWRALLKIKHIPEQLIDVTIFPVMMLLMFTYLFGGALDEGGPRSYLQFFLPGIVSITVLMTTMYTGIGLNADAEKGVFDRFRSLPTWRPAMIVGALLGDAVRYTLSSTIMIALGLALGFRPTGGGALGLVLAVALLLVFAFSLSWVWTTLGLVMRNEKTVMNTSMMILFPLTFLSNVFVEPETMPAWLQRVVDINPISHMVTAARSLIADNPDGAEIGWVLLASALLVGIFGSLTMRLYRTKN